MPAVLRHELEDGEAWEVQQHFYLSCCDCGLRHHFLMNITGKDTATLRIYRDPTGTEINRRGFKAPKYYAKPRKRPKDKKKPRR